VLEVIVYFDHGAGFEDSAPVATFDSAITAMAFKKKLIKHDRGINKAEVQKCTPLPHNISFEDWAKEHRHPPMLIKKDECDSCGDIQELQKITRIEAVVLQLDPSSWICNECYHTAY